MEETRNNGLPQDDVWIVCPDKILRSLVPKIQRILKMTVFQEVCIDSTILVSFSFAEDVLSNDVKKYDIFGLQGTENPPFRFFLGTRGITVNFVIRLNSGDPRVLFELFHFDFVAIFN